MENDGSEEAEKNLDRGTPVGDAGFIQFYGLYWRKDLVGWPKKEILGQPEGWTGQGKIAKGSDR